MTGLFTKILREAFNGEGPVEYTNPDIYEAIKSRADFENVRDVLTYAITTINTKQTLQKEIGHSDSETMHYFFLQAKNANTKDDIDELMVKYIDFLTYIKDNYNSK